MKNEDDDRPARIKQNSATPKRPVTSEFIEDMNIEDRMSLSLGRDKRAKVARNNNAKSSKFAVMVRDAMTQAWGVKFSKTIGSGRFGNVSDYDKNLLEAMVADLGAHGFKFAPECKKGYDKYDLWQCFMQKGKDQYFSTFTNQVGEFINQTIRDSDKLGRMPLVIWAKMKKPALVILPESFYRENINHFPPAPVMIFHGYAMLRFSDFVQLPKEVVFEK